MTIWTIPHSTGAKIVGWQQESKLLKTAPSRFASTRPHTAFIPPQKSAEKMPVLYCLAPWTSAGRTQLQWEAFREDLPTRLMRLIQNKIIPACVVVCPDLFIDYGGSQFIDSEWVGAHASHMVEELVPWVEANLPVLPGAKHRGVFGRSSGGFGALRLAMDFPGVFHAVACHAGDMGFDWVYRRSLIDLCTGLVKYPDPLAFMDALKQQKKISGWDTNILMLLGMCAFYSPNPHTPWGFDLPIDLKTAEVIDAVYSRWQAHDPVILAQQSRHQEALGKLSCLFIDCGNRDQYFLQYGSRRLSKILKGAGVSHTYSEFDDNHSGTAYRYDESLPQMLAQLT